MKKITSKKISKIPKSFLLFLLASFLFWGLINLSKKYKTVVSFPVTYVNLPQNKLLKEVPVKEISVVVEGTGFQLLGLKIKNKSIFLAINSLPKDNKNLSILSLSEQRIKIQNQLENKVKIDGFLQDKIFLKIGDLASKKVPVILDVDLKFSAGYNLSEKIKITPDSILISGVKSVLDTIKFLKTHTLKLSNINKSIKKEIAIKTPKNLDLKMNVSKVLVQGKVDKFTEGTFLLPYKIINVPKGIVVNTFPKKVKVVFTIGLSHFNEINKNSFSVVCDFKEAQENNLTYLIPKLEHIPILVKSVKLVPNKIEYLIQKE